MSTLSVWIKEFPIKILKGNKQSSTPVDNFPRSSQVASHACFCTVEGSHGRTNADTRRICKICKNPQRKAQTLGLNLKPSYCEVTVQTSLLPSSVIPCVVATKVKGSSLRGKKNVTHTFLGWNREYAPFRYCGWP